MTLNKAGHIGGLGIVLFLSWIAIALGDDPPAIDDLAVADAIRHEDASEVRTLLLPLITTTFGSHIQTRDVNLWLMRSYVSDNWSAVHMCLEVRIEEAETWTEWLPAAAWAFAPIGDLRPRPSASIAGWDISTGTRRFASLKDFASAALENDIETMRTECYHMNDDSKDAARKSLLKRLSP